MIAVAPCGYVIANREMTITIIPNPILAKRALPLPMIPETTFSIPAKNNKSARMKITETPPITGLSKTSIDRIKITAPRPIWAIRIQPGDLSIFKWKPPSEKGWN
jgi:hypothetical protein